MLLATKSNGVLIRKLFHRSTHFNMIRTLCRFLYHETGILSDTAHFIIKVHKKLINCLCRCFFYCQQPIFLKSVFLLGRTIIKGSIASSSRVWQPVCRKSYKATSTSPPVYCVLEAYTFLFCEWNHAGKYSVVQLCHKFTAVKTKKTDPKCFTI